MKETSISRMTREGIPKGSRILVNRGRGNDELAPSEALLKDLMAAKEEVEKDLGGGSDEAHNRAFLDVDYEARFRRQILENPAALAKLEGLSRRADTEDLYLVCYEGPRKACHRRILMRIAEESFGARVAVEGVEPRR